MSFGEEKFGKSLGLHEGNDRAGKTLPDSTDTNRAELVGVVRVLVEGKKATISQVLGKFGRHLIVKDQGEKLGEEAEAFGVAGLVGGGQPKCFDGICEVAEGTIESATFSWVRALWTSSGVTGRWG